jgi:hypothetical protein
MKTGHVTVQMQMGFGGRKEGESRGRQGSEASCKRGRGAKQRPRQARTSSCLPGAALLPCRTCAALLAAVKSFKYSRAASGSAAAEGSAMDALRAEKSSGPCLAVMAPLGGNGGRREGQVDA